METISKFRATLAWGKFEWKEEFTTEFHGVRHGVTQKKKIFLVYHPMTERLVIFVV